MSRLRALLLVPGLLIACSAEPLPADKADYAGHWRGKGVDLVIEASGQVQYRKAKGKGQVEISGPITQWIDEDFVVGVMVVKTKFDVTEPPHEVDGIWMMTVDEAQVVRDGP